jgi:hypothetical protein
LICQKIWKSLIRSCSQHFKVVKTVRGDNCSRSLNELLTAFFMSRCEASWQVATNFEATS